MTDTEDILEPMDECGKLIRECDQKLWRKALIDRYNLILNNEPFGTDDQYQKLTILDKEIKRLADA